ncbi:MAG: hypothetical protein AAF583_16955 [Pseudomonadota bacterium]
MTQYPYCWVSGKQRAVHEDLFELPYGFCVPDLLYKRELDGELGDRLVALGLDIVELSPAELARATGLRREIKVLSTPDTFAFSLAEARRWTLLTGDGALRKLADEQGVAMHGVLWIIEELHNGGIANGQALHEALTTIHAHPRCRLPNAEVRRILAALIR